MSRLGHGHDQDPASASGLSLSPDLNTVDRELVVGLDSSLDSSRLIEVPYETRGLPLVDCLDLYTDRVGDEVRSSPYLDRAD